MSTAVPGHLLPHTVTLIRPVQVTDAYGSTDYDYGPAATRTPIRAWLQQNIRRELSGVSQDGRITQDERWLLVTNHPDVRPRDRFEWTGPTGPLRFETDGPPAPTYTPRGLHHTEVALAIITG
ncbi:hypothetical protein ACFXGC_36750 [Streptomyces olivaceus]|uniref:hypothetical protein n=1 Tax=Streptomyces olivaceus TaxID=47716 RepID=UPI0036B75E97